MLNKSLAFCTVLLLSLSVNAQRTNQWAQLVDQNLHIYSLLEKRRDAAETVVLKGNTLQIRYRKDLRKLSRKQRDQFICDATRWMIAGRLASSSGLGRLLEAAPSVSTVKFVAFAVDTSVSINRRGRYDQSRKLIPQMVLSIDRKRVAQIDAKTAAKNLGSKSCLKVSKALLNEVWTNTR